MKKFFALLVHPWTLAFLGLLALSLLIWFIGPLVSIDVWRPLASSNARLFCIGLIVGIYVLVKLVGWLRARKRNRAVVGQLAAGADTGGASAEVQQLQTRFAQALTALRDVRLHQQHGLWSSLSSRYSRRYLYELPWYVIVGAPGSGKTTALLNSGLQFPLADRFGAGSIKGVGGTRNCDWWFAEQAVLIDTAGRYTTHESDPEADRSAWEGFLGLLKRTRPRRPLNGILVTVSIADLLLFTARQRAEHAATLRKRVDELQQQLGLRLPVYVLVTKCDLLAGFMDYFADGDRIERGQPWGFTFDEAASQAGSVGERFAPEFDRLTQRLLDGVIDRVQVERDRERRARIYGFPQQFGGLRTAMAEMIGTLGASSTYAVAPLVRGVYFVSGTQEGTPFDRMMGALARDLRLDRGLLPPNRSTGRSFFLSQVLADVVFAEADLVGTNLAWERKRTALIWGTYGLSAVLSGLLLVGWTMSYFNNRAAVDEFAVRTAALRSLIEATPNRATSELLPILPALTATAELARPETQVGLAHGLGLYQGARLRVAAGLVYRRMLADALLPRIALHIEEMLRASGNNPQLLYEALKAYVMLHSPDNYDSKALQQFISADWNANLAGQLTPDQRTALEGHLLALFELPVVAAPLADDKALVERVRLQISSQSLPQRIYERLKFLQVGSELPEFTVIRAGGPKAELVFVRASGQPLTRGVEGLYTYDGYHEAFQKAVESASSQLADEQNWVLGTGERRNVVAEALQTPHVSDAVRQLYLRDYIEKWDSFIADVRLIRASRLEESLQQARDLSAPDNPLAPLMRGIAHETTLVPTPDTQGVLAQAEARAKGALQDSREQLSRLLFDSSAKPKVDKAAAPEQVVDDHFAALHAMVKSAGSGAPAPLDNTIALIGEVYNTLNVANLALRGGDKPPPSDTPAKVSAEAARLPEPLRSLLVTLSKESQTATLSAERSTLSKDVNASIGQFCRQAIEGRYPLSRISDRDVALDDFTRVFGPGGLFEDFFTRNLAAYVDTTNRPWTFRQRGEATMGADSGTLLEFERASVIRTSLFRSGHDPSMKLQFTPYDMDPTISEFDLDVDGQLVQWKFGPKIPIRVQWPGPRGGTQVRLTLASDRGGSSIVKDGPWALFHLFDRMQVDPVPNAPERFRVTFNIEGRKAIFDVDAGTVQNPFTLRELREFHCPTGL